MPLVTQSANVFLRNKRQEWEEYRSEVTAFELRKSLPVL
ncbi:glutamine synthetase [Streptomyces sp. JJ66]|nr:glutamine synthetase [Streptomyces sp. JJ66]